jgi:hypothetical protein
MNPMTFDTKQDRLILYIFNHLPYNYNGFDLQLLYTLKLFDKDIEEVLTHCNFIKVSESELFVNPKFAWRGTEVTREYYQDCFDKGEF